MSAVSDLLRTGGAAYVQPNKERFPLFKRQELRKGAKFVFAGVLSFIPCLILSAILDSVFPFAIPFIIAAPFVAFLAGLVQIFYFLLFGESILPFKKQEQSFASNEPPHRLDFQAEQRFSFEPRSFDTNEFIHPPSITEPTKNLTENK